MKFLMSASTHTMVAVSSIKMIEVKVQEYTEHNVIAGSKEGDDVVQIHTVKTKYIRLLKNLLLTSGEDIAFDSRDIVLDESSENFLESELMGKLSAKQLAHVKDILHDLNLARAKLNSIARTKTTLAHQSMSIGGLMSSGTVDVKKLEFRERKYNKIYNEAVASMQSLVKKNNSTSEMTMTVTEAKKHFADKNWIMIENNIYDFVNQNSLTDFSMEETETHIPPSYVQNCEENENEGEPDRHEVFKNMENHAVHSEED